MAKHPRKKSHSHKKQKGGFLPWLLGALGTGALGTIGAHIGQKVIDKSCSGIRTHGGWKKRHPQHSHRYHTRGKGVALGTAVKDELSTNFHLKGIQR